MFPMGARIMFGGFGGAGFPNNLIQALARKGTTNITAITNNCGTRERRTGLDVQEQSNQPRHRVFPGAARQSFSGTLRAKEVTLELVPQGILCERMRAAAAGLTGFYTTVGVGTEVAWKRRARDRRRALHPGECPSARTTLSSRHRKPTRWAT